MSEVLFEAPTPKYLVEEVSRGCDERRGNWRTECGFYDLDEAVEYAKRSAQSHPHYKYRVIENPVARAELAEKLGLKIISGAQ